MDITISLITTLVLTLINGYFSMSEMALTTAKRAVLEHEAEEGDKRAERAIKLAADSDQLLATIQVAITLVGFASSAVASFANPGWSTMSVIPSWWHRSASSRRARRLFASISASEEAIFIRYEAWETTVSTEDPCQAR